MLKWQLEYSWDWPTTKNQNSYNNTFAVKSKTSCNVSYKSCDAWVRRKVEFSFKGRRQILHIFSPLEKHLFAGKRHVGCCCRRCAPRFLLRTLHLLYVAVFYNWITWHFARQNGECVKRPSRAKIVFKLLIAEALWYFTVTLKMWKCNYSGF